MVIAARRCTSLSSIVILVLAAAGAAGCKKDIAKDADAAADAEAGIATDAAVAVAEAGADAAVADLGDAGDAAAPVAVATAAATGKPKIVDPPICAHARTARARNSPAAPGLEAQCKAQGGKL